MRLENLVLDFEREATRLRQQFDSQSLGPGMGYWDGPRGAIHAYAVVRLHDAWSRFCRQLILVSGRGNVVTIGGVYISRSPVVQSGQLALDALKSTYNPARQSRHLWEPRWFDSSDAIDAARRLQIRNFSTVSGGIGLSVTVPGISWVPPDELRACRNYLAHRNRLASDQLANLRARLGVSSSTTVDELPRLLVGGGASVFAVWCVDLGIRARTAAR